MCRVAFRRFRRFLAIALAIPLMLVVFTGLEPTARSTQSSLSDQWYMLLFPAGFVIFLYGNLYYSSRKQWAKNPAIRESRRIVISEEGLDIKGETFAGQNEWVNIGGGEKLRDLFILSTRGGGAYYLLPVRCFRSESQVREFTDFMRTKFGRAFKIEHAEKKQEN